MAVLVEFFPPRMGSDRRIYELMRRLAEEHEINFLLIPPFREQVKMLSSETSSRPATSTHVHEGITTYRVEIPKIMKEIWRKSLKLGYMLSMALLIPRVIRELVKVNPEIIVLNYPSVYTGVLGFFAAKFLRRRCVVDFNDLIAQYTINLLNLENSSFTGTLILLIQDFIIKKSDIVVAPTDFIRKYALALGLKDENISVIPNGVDMQVFNAKIKSDYRSKLSLNDKRICLFFGRLEEWAGIRILIDVCSVFEQKSRDIRFLIVGGGSKEVEFPRNVVMVKEVPHCQVPKILAVADVVLVPFPENEVSHAASPLRLFEGMAMRKPIIASKVSGIKEVIQNGYNGLLVDPNNPKEWVETVEAVMSSRSLQKKLGENAEESAKKYDWNVLASRFEDTLTRGNIRTRAF